MTARPNESESRGCTSKTTPRKICTKDFRTSDEKSYVDYNRGGTPLAEMSPSLILRSPAEAHAYLTALKQVLLYTEVSDWQYGRRLPALRRNVSVRRRGAEKFGTKAEVKNLNSFRHLQHALEYEIERQSRCSRRAADRPGNAFVECRCGTHRADALEGIAHDYRYFPEPDLLPVHVSPAWRDEIAETMPNCPKRNAGDSSAISASLHTTPRCWPRRALLAVI